MIHAGDYLLKTEDPGEVKIAGRTEQVNGQYKAAKVIQLDRPEGTVWFGVPDYDIGKVISKAVYENIICMSSLILEFFLWHSLHCFLFTLILLHFDYFWIANTPYVQAIPLQTLAFTVRRWSKNIDSTFHNILLYSF